VNLQDVADKLDATEELCDRLPESDLRDEIVASLQSAYRALVATSGDLVQLLDDLQEHTRDIRSISHSG
jgi:ABC-type transporter Mla subunit MlaD